MSIKRGKAILKHRLIEREKCWIEILEILHPQVLNKTNKKKDTQTTMTLGLL